MASLEERIRRRAYQIWQEEGCPTGQEERHWEMARQIIASEGSADEEEETGGALAPDPAGSPQSGEASADPFDPADPAGDFPPSTTPGGQQATPSRRRAKADPEPLSPIGKPKGRRRQT
jgi:Protein of unknown function (DUF2934).